MKTTVEEFSSQPNKAITLLGMSGIGKTTLANKLPKSDWFHYSGDYRIGTKYLKEPILDNIKEQSMEIDFLAELLRTDSIYISSNITVDNLLPISTFLGKIGDKTKGGLSLDEFLKRQKMHKDAEIKAMLDGIVTLAEPDLFYTGGTLIFDHGHGVSTLYMHLKDIYVKSGQEDKQGEIIGTVGSTGRSTGPHLDFRVNWFQTRLDPMSVIN